MPRYFELEVSLQSIQPRIWRRFQIAESASFYDLHCAIQDAFGWCYGHLWEFCDSRAYKDAFAGCSTSGSPGFGFGFGFDAPDAPDARRVSLAAEFGQGRKRCVYVYDFGDDWVHKVQLKKTVELEEVFFRRLLAGARNGPPEDCGGVWGHGRLVALKANPAAASGDDANLLEWSGSWDPEDFDLKAIKEGFDSARVVAGLSLMPAVVVELPAGSDPGHVAVTALLVEKLGERETTAEFVEYATQLWADFVAAANPRPRKAAIWAAAVEYCASAVEGLGSTQAEIAESYGISVASLSQRWREIMVQLGLQQAPRPRIEG